MFLVFFYIFLGVIEDGIYSGRLCNTRIVPLQLLDTFSRDPSIQARVKVVVVDDDTGEFLRKIMSQYNATRLFLLICRKLRPKTMLFRGSICLRADVISMMLCSRLL